MQFSPISSGDCAQNAHVETDSILMQDDVLEMQIRCKCLEPSDKPVFRPQFLCSDREVICSVCLLFVLDAKIFRAEISLIS